VARSPNDEAAKFRLCYTASIAVGSAGMAIPPFNLDGVLPPFVGPHGPGGDPQDMSPCGANPVEVVTRFATTVQRCEILKGWLGHRDALNRLGLSSGFQWLDGSFVEAKQPNDLDVVTFFRRPTSASSQAAIAALLT
jgi:Family of unknown function (DUF6932)